MPLKKYKQNIKHFTINFKDAKKRCRDFPNGRVEKKLYGHIGYTSVPRNYICLLADA